MKDTSRKLTRRMEDVPQDPELTGSLPDEKAETPAAEQGKAAEEPAMDVQQADEAAEDGKDRKTES